jgi:hypothetical protein
VSDHFARLSEARRPWVELEPLKIRFYERSAQVHPDRFHEAEESVRLAATQDYAEYNAAYQVLREPRERLLHLIELESGAKPRDIQKIPPGTMDLFVEIGQACREGDEFLKQKAAATSPMLKLRLLQAGLEWMDRFLALQERVNAQRTALEGELQALNAVWASAPPVGDPGRLAALPLERLEVIYRAMSYVARWTSQIQERVVQLAV